MRLLAYLLAIVALVVAALLVWPWIDEEPSPPSEEETAEVVWAPTDSLTEAEVEAGRHDDDWRDGIEFPIPEPRELGLDTIAIPESWGDIGELAGDVAEPGAAADETDGERDAPPGVEPRPTPVPTRPAVHLPLGGQVEGPSVLRAQVLLDRARFSPGIIDGRWGKNTEKAVLWLQHDEGLTPTGIVDSLTFERLWKRAGRPVALVTTRALTEEDVAGPFAPIPADVYTLAKQSCSCYESRSEKLAERFHASIDVLRELNPEVALDSLAAGDTLRVPDVDGRPSGSDPGSDIVRLQISGAGYYVHAIDADGRIVYHFPATLGSRYDPSPEGNLTVVSIHPDPWFHYQPKLLAGVDPSLPNASLPPGPNNLVGDTWIKLSEPHYGIHGTRSPETIGYATSSGCVRLTNWDARFLRDRVSPGTPVVFTGTRSTEVDSLSAPAGR